MARYFFHMASDEHRLLDGAGREMSTLSAAYEYAIHLIDQAGAAFAPEDIEDWRINVANASGRIELVVLFPRKSVGQTSRSTSIRRLNVDSRFLPTVRVRSEQ
jgi:Domain of unknown function (DUF6894)